MTDVARDSRWSIAPDGNSVVTFSDRSESPNAGTSVTAGETAFQFIITLGAQMIQQSNRVVGEVAITHANIKYGHIYLSSILDAFPVDTIGGTNKMQSANATLSIDWGGNSLVETDIDGRKKIFRARAWVRDFFDRNSVRAGDYLVFERIATRVFKVRVKHRAGQTGRPISQA